MLKTNYIFKRQLHYVFNSKKIEVENNQVSLGYYNLP